MTGKIKQHLFHSFISINDILDYDILDYDLCEVANEPSHEKTNKLHIRKQRRISAVQ